jgi:CHAT domain-containing protein/chaperonin cofactor prefoldin
MMKLLLLVFLITIPITASAAEESPYEANGVSIREAISRGEAREALDALETKASAAEKNAASSPAPEPYLTEASSAYREAARAALSSGQFSKAIAHATKALEIGEKLKSPYLQAAAIYHLQQAYQGVRDSAKRKEWIERGSEVAKQIPNEARRQYMRADFARELGTLLLQEGKKEEAIQNLSDSTDSLDRQVALLKNRRTQNPNSVRFLNANESSLVYGLYWLGIAYQRAGRVDDSIQTYERGIRAIKNSGAKTPTEFYFYRGLGDLYLGKKEYSKALENLDQALAMAEKMRIPQYVYLASSEMGDLYLQTQKAAEAIPFYKKAVENVESIRSLLDSEEFRSSYFEDKRTTYGGLILAYARTKNFEEAFNYSERARSRAFLDILGSKVQLARSGTLLEQERALQARISVLQAMIAGEGSEESERPGLRRDLDDAQKSYNEFLAEVRKENKEQASLMNVEPLTLKQVRELLDPGVTMLEYFVLRQSVFLWVVERDRLRFVSVPISRTDLVSKIRWFRDKIYQLGEKEESRSYSQELYKLLIEPALPQIRGKDLLIIPHDVLHYLPFQSLMSAEGKYLVQDYSIYYLSSASLMQFTKEKRRANRTDEKALALGNPDLNDAAYDLRFAEREVREIARDYPKSTVLVGAQATKAKVISLSPNNDILHFAVHAQFNQEDPTSSALLLAREGQGDGKLKVGEIFSLNLKADLVVLSACETGLGKVSNGDEIIGLTRAFIYAGTPSIITTLWKVNDQASYELMREFYSNLKTMKKDQALRQAQLKTMKEFPEPFFWAAYELTGEP